MEWDKDCKKGDENNIVIKVFIIISLLLLCFINNVVAVKVAILVIISVLALKMKQCINKYKKMNSNHKINEERYLLSIEAMNGVIWEWDERSDLIHMSHKIREMLNIDKSHLTLEEWYKYVHEDDLKRVRKYFDNICYNKICIDSKIEYSIIGAKGEVIYLQYIGRGAIKNDIYHLAGVLTDVTKDKQRELKLHFMNYYDDITGIPNRKMFTKKFEELIEENGRNRTKLALLFFDIDNFKSINDTYGHDIGDSILMKICQRVYEVLDEKCAFARFGGDEFVIAFSGMHDELEIKHFLNDLLINIRKPIEVNKKKIYCSVSIGISIYPRDAERLDLLLKTADMAMYKAKEEGKNRYEFFDVRISKILKRQYDIEKALRVAIDKDELFMVFQPKVSIKGEKINGFEALVRWNSEELGFVSPAEFIPIAEACGLIVDLGKYIVEESFKKCKELIDFTESKFHMAINISDIQLRENGFIEFISDLLKEYEIPPEYIQFEITEGVIMQSVARNIELLLNLRRLGVTIALDDFGTGYSSLSYLKRLPIDVLKIDKSFVDGIGVDEKSECIAESIINLSHNLDLKVVAEGVETREQLGYLDRMECDVAQGYYFSRPEKFDNIKEMI